MRSSLLLSQHLAIAPAFEATGAALAYDMGFWLSPLRRLAILPQLTAWMAALAFAFSLTVAWVLAHLSFRRASRSGFGYLLAALSVVPAVQIAAAMEEMSPYRRVHAQHVQGYFETAEIRFTLHPLRGGGTRLAVDAVHRLRMDPVLYWEPVARWAIHAHAARVLGDILDKAQAGR